MEMQPFESSHPNVTDFELHDFIDSGNIEQFIDIFRGENTDLVSNYNPSFDGGDLMFNAEFVDNQFNVNLVDVFDFNSTSASVHRIFNDLPVNISSGNVGEEEENDGNDSSDTTTTTPTKRNRIDRSRTLVSERKRRGRMKEKLYALRALVPNITKMDKASIVGDAVSYVQELQMQTKKLNSEIAALESTLNGQGRVQGLVANQKKNQVVDNKQPIYQNITQMDVFQVEEKGYYARVVCNKGEGVAVALYKALESLTCLDIQSSNLSMGSEQFVLTFTINVRECGEEMNLSTMKLWVAGIFMNQGFEFRPHMAS